jgi:hypothetical protein
LLQSVQGIGPIVSATLLGELPELGTLTHKADRHTRWPGALARDSGDPARETHGMGRARAGADRAAHGRVVWAPVESPASRVLRASDRARETEEGRRDRLCADPPVRLRTILALPAQQPYIT